MIEIICDFFDTINGNYALDLMYLTVRSDNVPIFRLLLRKFVTEKRIKLSPRKLVKAIVGNSESAAVDCLKATFDIFNPHEYHGMIEEAYEVATDKSRTSVLWFLHDMGLARLVPAGTEQKLIFRVVRRDNPSCLRPMLTSFGLKTSVSYSINHLGHLNPEVFQMINYLVKEPTWWLANLKQWLSDTCMFLLSSPPLALFATHP